jgi:hypothetical protein
MNPVVVATLSVPFVAGTTAGAVSSEARYIGQQTADSWREIQSSRALGCGDLLDQLDEIRETCSRGGWDGHSAVSVSRESVDMTARLLDALPLMGMRPTVGVEPDGQVTLEWYASPHRLISVSMDPAGDLHYAARIGPERQYGTVPFFGEVPARITDLVRRVSSQ